MNYIPAISVGLAQGMGAKSPKRVGFERGRTCSGQPDPLFQRDVPKEKTRKKVEDQILTFKKTIKEKFYANCYGKLNEIFKVTL